MPDPYASLRRVLDSAYDRAAKTKGAERHAGPGQRFEDQPILQIARHRGAGFLLGQMDKKLAEADRLPTEQALNEISDALVYLAAYRLLVEETRKNKVDKPQDPL